ncbi:hypothetical protein ACWEN3_30950, partial [Streptomyces sp. NPDC004561]
AIVLRSVQPGALAGPETMFGLSGLFPLVTRLAANGTPFLSAARNCSAPFGFVESTPVPHAVAVAVAVAVWVAVAVAVTVFVTVTVGLTVGQLPP